LGYVGLPMAVMLANRGFDVTGVDIDATVRSRLAKGQVETSEDGVTALLTQALDTGAFAVAERPVPSDVFVIAVPTPIVNGDSPSADLSHVRAAAQAVAPALRKGNLVILESTVPPGATDDVLVPELELSGLKAGKDVRVAHVPERVLPGNVLSELAQNPRVIGGVDRASAEAARELYARFVEGEIILTDARTAEMVKLMENTYRDVNVALANEFAVLAEALGVDIWRAIAIANQHPRVNVLRPGPGVGGHCIPVDPWFLAAATASSQPAPLISAARAVNDAMPARVCDTLGELHSDLSEPVVALLGLAYKAGTDDTRNSPALAVARTLRSWGWTLRLHDPYAGAPPDLGESFASPAEAATGADCLLLMTDHREFQSLDPSALRPLMRRPLVFDTRGIIDEATWRAAGFHVRRLGVPPAP
jgi:UDP-N-acetyl-D-mannosaminuronic acid dehydrogenase